MYSKLLVQDPFPKTLRSIRRVKRLSGMDFLREVAWLAAILQRHIDPLRMFCAARDAFYASSIQGNFTEAERILADIETQFGFSIWLITHRLQLVQWQYGLKEQKALLEATISIEGMNQFIAFIAFYASFRAEENFTLDRLLDEMSDILSLDELGDYMRYHTVPYDLTAIRSTAVPIAWEETQPIIDRFQVLIAMVPLEFSRSAPSCGSALGSILRPLAAVEDRTLNRLLEVLPDDGVIRRPTDHLGAFDAYTEGRYDDLGSMEAPFELLARAELLCGRRVHKFPDGSIGAEIVRNLSQLLAAPPAFAESRIRLQKLALSCQKQPCALEIASVVERTHSHSVPDQFSPLDRLTAVETGISNPWSLPVLEGVTGREILREEFARFPESPSLGLRYYLTQTVDSAVAGIRTLRLPPHRSQLYEGHARLRSKDFEGAVSCYAQVQNEANPLLSITANSHLFRALYDGARHTEAVDLVVDHCLALPGSHRLYPVELLARRVQAERSAFDPIAAAIVLSLAARHVHPKWERDLSDAFEYALDQIGITRASELSPNSPAINAIDLNRAIYFLRYVCVPRILDSSITFANVSEVEAERVSICQTLTLLDPINDASYSTEIRAITRDAEVARLLKQVEASKIYIDEDGIRSVLDEPLRASYARYKQLLDSPDLDYRTEKISKRLEALLKDKAPSDLKNLRLPASEREGLFAAILQDVATQFALNQAYGLDTHVGTGIRHGAFEGNVRASFAAESLLCTYAKEDEDWLLPEIWTTKLSGLSDTQLQYVRKQLGRLTERVEELIAQWVGQFLRVKVVGDHPYGMFNFDIPDAERREFAAFFKPNTTFHDFFERLLTYCRARLDESLDGIRLRLQDELLTQLVDTVDVLIMGIEHNIGHVPVKDLIDAAVRSKTELHSAIAVVSGWFHRPADLLRAPFEIDLAVGVALKQIQACYVRPDLTPTIHSSVPFKLRGQFLDGFVEVFFLLLQNVIRHSGVNDLTNAVMIDIVHISNELTITVSNTVAPDVDLVERRRLAADAQARYDQDTALKLAGRDSGSGLSKMWRISQFDLQRRHTLELDVTEDRRFVARFRCNNDGLADEDLPN